VIGLELTLTITSSCSSGIRPLLPLRIDRGQQRLKVGTKTRQVSFRKRLRHPKAKSCPYSYPWTIPTSEANVTRKNIHLGTVRGLKYRCRVSVLCIKPQRLSAHESSGHSQLGKADEISSKVHSKVA